MILVLGAGGTVGRYLCDELDQRGVPYRAAYRSPQKLEAALADDQDAVALDLQRPQTVRAAMDGVSRVFLLTSATPDLAELEHTAIAEAQRAGVEFIVKVSVWQAADEHYAFARWHAPAEAELAATGIDHSILRPNGYMQSQTEAIAGTVRDHGAFFVPDLHGRAAYIDARDVAACAAVLLVDDPPAPDRRIWSLTGPEAFDAVELASCIGEVLRKPVRAVLVDPPAWRDGLLAAGLPEWLADALLDMSSIQARDDFGHLTEDVATLLGRKPRSFRDFLLEHREALSS